MLQNKQPILIKSRHFSNTTQVKINKTYALRVGGAYNARGLTGGGLSRTTSTPDELSSERKASAAPSTAFLEALKATRPARFLEMTLASESPKRIMRPVDRKKLLEKYVQVRRIIEYIFHIISLE